MDLTVVEKQCLLVSEQSEHECGIKQKQRNVEERQVGVWTLLRFGECEFVHVTVSPPLPPPGSGTV